MTDSRSLVCILFEINVCFRKYLVTRTWFPKKSFQQVLCVLPVFFLKRYFCEKRIRSTIKFKSLRLTWSRLSVHFRRTAKNIPVKLIFYIVHDVLATITTTICMTLLGVIVAFDVDLKNCIISEKLSLNQSHWISAHGSKVKSTLSLDLKKLEN